MNYQGFLIDLDGTMYRGRETINEAVKFVQTLQKKGLPYLFVTNNSTKRPEAVAEILQSMQIPATAQHVFTTSMATAAFVSKKSESARIFSIGEEGLRAALMAEGHQLVDTEADYVVMGLDREITYDKLAAAVLQIRAGAQFIATNGDVALPTERGLMPGAGSLVATVSVSTGIQPTFIGKPEPIIVEQALEVIGTAKETTLMVGDNYDTDIMAGLRIGMDTLLVHTGVTTKEQLTKKKEKPTFTVDSLAEWRFDALERT